MGQRRVEDPVDFIPLVSGSDPAAIAREWQRRTMMAVEECNRLEAQSKSLRSSLRDMAIGPFLIGAICGIAAIDAYRSGDPETWIPYGCAAFLLLLSALLAVLVARR